MPMPPRCTCISGNGREAQFLLAKRRRQVIYFYFSARESSYRRKVTMLKKMIAYIAVGTLAAVLISGCASPQTMDAPGNTTLSSAAVGGLSGAAIGAAVDKKNRGAGALIGAGVGTLGGALVGNQMEKNRDKAMQQAPPPPPPKTY
jgi:hypothetical protein